MAKKKKSKTSKKEFAHSAELYGVLYILCAILGLGKYGPVGRFINSFFIFLVGSLYMVFLVVVLIVGAYLVIKREWPDFFTSKLLGIYVLVLGLLFGECFCIFVELFLTFALCFLNFGYLVFLFGKWFFCFGCLFLYFGYSVFNFDELFLIFGYSLFQLCGATLYCR